MSAGAVPLEVVLASDNRGKWQEFAHLFAPLGVRLVPQGAFGVTPAPEPYATFLENALAKARHAARYTGRPALADDSGLVVPALGSAPGVYSTRFAGEPRSDARNNEKLLAAMAHLTGAARRAYYYACLVWVAHADDPTPFVAEGRWWGEIAHAPRGNNGFGYDPLFVDPEVGKTAAEMTPAEKNVRSHRGRAAAQLLAAWPLLAAAVGGTAS